MWERQLAKKTVRLIDPETGEVLDTQLGIYRKKSKNGFLKWSAVNAEVDLMLAKNEPTSLPPMNLTDFRVYHGLRAFAEEGNLVRVPQITIATAIGMAQSNFSASVNRLCKLGIVEKGDKIGRSFPLRLSPLSTWIGQAEDHREEIRQYDTGKRTKFRVVG